jgi:hypothetical protein
MTRNSVWNRIFGLKCPDCRQPILDNDVICPHCRVILDEPLAQEAETSKNRLEEISVTSQPRSTDKKTDEFSGARILLSNVPNADAQKKGRKLRHSAKSKQRYHFLAIILTGMAFMFFSMFATLGLQGAESLGEPLSDRQIQYFEPLLLFGMLLILLGILLDTLHMQRERVKREARQSPYIDRRMQRRAGLIAIAEGCVFGVVLATLVLAMVAINKTESNFWRGLLCPILPLFIFTFIITIQQLNAGIGILLKGVPFDPPEQIITRFCPYCHHVLEARDLPSPGHSASCPKCGKNFFRKDW